MWLPLSSVKIWRELSSAWYCDYLELMIAVQSSDGERVGANLALAAPLHLQALAARQAEQDERGQAQDEQEGEQDQRQQDLLHPHPGVHAVSFLHFLFRRRLYVTLFTAAGAAEQNSGYIRAHSALLSKQAAERRQRLQQDRVQAEERANPLPRVRKNSAGLAAGVSGVGLVALDQSDAARPAGTGRRGWTAQA